MYKATATIYVVSRNDSVLNFSDLQVGSELTSDVSRQELLDVKQQIEQTGCPILGTVLNQVDYDNYMGRKYYKSYSKYGKYGYYKKYYKRSTKQKRNERLYGIIMRTSSTVWTTARRRGKKCMPCWMRQAYERLCTRVGQTTAQKLTGLDGTEYLV